MRIELCGVGGVDPKSPGRDEAHNSFPDTPKIERMEKELEGLMD